MFFSEIFLVQLFSSPQQQVAASTSIEPEEKEKLPAPPTESRILDSVINAIAAQSRFETASLKINSAITVVATISKLPRSDALADEP